MKIGPFPAKMPRHTFRLPSLHRLNTKDLAAPPTAITTSPSNGSHGYQPLTTPPLAVSSSHQHTDSTTLSPSSTTSSVPGSFTTTVSNNSSSSSSSSTSRIRHLLALRRKQSRINIEREIADEHERFGGPSGGFLSVMEPRPGVARGDGGAGGVVMGGIFEVLGSGR